METILIIEDDELIRENLCELFTNEGYLVYSANDGKQGIYKAKEIVPTLIISDIMMPELDGYQVYRELRKEPLLSVIPFIFLSALSDKSNIRTGMGLGADDYITKPFVNSELLEVARNRIEKNKILKQSMEDLKLNLIRSVPHEFFTPLNAVLGFSELLIDASKSDEEISKEEVLEFSEYIHSAGSNLLRLTKNYVLFTELITMGDNDSIKALFRSGISQNIKDPLSKFCIDLAKKLDRRKDIEFDFENANLNISAHNLEKIVEEIFDNAVKFSLPNSMISIKGVKNEIFYQIQIKDKGIGMNSEEISKIQYFVQFNREMNEQSGLGLGLSLVMKILELINGKFHIESEKEKGTIVTLKIPVQK